MKVIITLPELEVGGAQRAATELANYLVHNNIDVYILLMFKREVYYTLDPKVTLIEPRNIRFKTGRLLYLPYLLYYLRSNIKKINPDVVFCLGYIMFLLYASLNLKNKVIISRRCNPLRPRFYANKVANKAYDILHYLVRARVDGVIAQTERAAEYYTNRYSCDVIVIPNILRKINPINTNIVREKIIVNVGRCVIEKGQHYLLKAFSQLDRSDWELWIIGDGPLKLELEELSRELKINDRVSFLGFRTDVDSMLAKCEIFAFSSISEGYPNALIEAMGNGLAVVSHDCDNGPSDIINHGVNGLLVPVGDTELFKDKIVSLIDNKDLRKKLQNNAKAVLESNNSCRISLRYLQFFEKVVHNSHN